MVEISRSKDGVRQWSGDAASYQEYEEQALQWEQSVEHKKRYLCGPKLIQEMSGTARKLVTGKRPDWLSFNGGVAHLMKHLRSSLGRPQIPELSEYLNRYFKQSRRRKFETMSCSTLSERLRCTRGRNRPWPEFCPSSRAATEATTSGQVRHGRRVRGAAHGEVLRPARTMAMGGTRVNKTRENLGLTHGDQPGCPG